MLPGSPRLGPTLLHMGVPSRDPVDAVRDGRQLFENDGWVIQTPWYVVPLVGEGWDIYVWGTAERLRQLGPGAFTACRLGGE